MSTFVSSFVSNHLSKTAALVVAWAFAMGGCSAQPAEFSWYHPQGGEYLFAYDKGECETQVTPSQALGVDTDGPFFQCMRQRGYALIDNNGIVQVPPIEVLATGQAASE